MTRSPKFRRLLRQNRKLRRRGFAEKQEARRPYHARNSYNLPDQAAGYFLHNFVDAVSPESVFSNSEVWFPRPGKELRRNGVRFPPWAGK